jgi:hypothetical protein
MEVSQLDLVRTHAFEKVEWDEQMKALITTHEADKTKWVLEQAAL